MTTRRLGRQGHDGGMAREQPEQGSTLVAQDWRNLLAPSAGFPPSINASFSESATAIHHGNGQGRPER